MTTGNIPALATDSRKQNTRVPRNTSQIMNGRIRTVAAMLIFLRRERGFGGCFSRFRLGVVDEPLEPFFLKFFNDVEDPLRVIRPLEPPFFLKLLNDVEDPLRVIRLGLGVNDDPLLSLHCFLAALRFFLDAMASIDDS